MKKNNKLDTFPINEIKYIRTKRPYIQIKLKNGKSSLIRESLLQWEKKLPEDHFIKINQSMIINVHSLSLIKKRTSALFVYLKDETQPFPVSRRSAGKLKDFR